MLKSIKEHPFQQLHTIQSKSLGTSIVQYLSFAPQTEPILFHANIYSDQNRQVDNTPVCITYTDALNNHQFLTSSRSMLESDQVQIKKPRRQGSSIGKQ